MGGHRKLTGDYRQYRYNNSVVPSSTPRSLLLFRHISYLFIVSQSLAVWPSAELLLGAVRMMAAHGAVGTRELSERLVHPSSKLSGQRPCRHAAAVVPPVRLSHLQGRALVVGVGALGAGEQVEVELRISAHGSQDIRLAEPDRHVSTSGLNPARNTRQDHSNSTSSWVVARSLRSSPSCGCSWMSRRRTWTLCSRTHSKSLGKPATCPLSIAEQLRVHSISTVCSSVITLRRWLSRRRL